MTVEIDLDHGGRWTSLVLGGREWLWRRDDPARAKVRPGDAFVDAGGLEECVPTVRGLPDHGDVWSRPWTRLGDLAAEVETPDFRLRRTVRETDGGVAASYVLTAEPGYRFVWAAHALLDLSDDARLHLPQGTAVRLFPEAAPQLGRPWPAGAKHIPTVWPRCDGIPLDRLGPCDGSAIGAIAVGPPWAAIHDGDDVLELWLNAPGLPVSTAIWRNLGGFPAGAPYRSIGVEPMLGSVFDLAEAEHARDAAMVGPSGVARWELVMRATRRRR